MEKAVLVHVQLTGKKYRDSWPAEEAALELKQLAVSCGLEISAQIPVRLEVPTPSAFVGKGKVQEIHDFCHRFRTQVAVFSCDLGVVQQRNLEEQLGIKVIDRTQLILDIFAQRARSQEGKVQVELAQLQYLLPRLSGKGTLLSRLGGGIGTRGPGEQKLEVDRRRIRVRIGRLQKELRAVSLRREVARRRRVEERVPVAALVGYTNAGKSTLLNALTSAGTVSRDQLFTTLDPLTRRLELPSGQSVVLADTVGFLHRLPHHLIQAFRATLEEVQESHLLLHVADGSSPLLEQKIDAVQEVLLELGAEQKPALLLLNQCDRLKAEDRRGLVRRYPEAVLISALQGEGLEKLRGRLVTLFEDRLRETSVFLSAAQMHWLSRLYKEGQVLERRTEGQGWVVRARLPERLLGQLRRSSIQTSP